MKQKLNLLARREESQGVIEGKESEDKGSHSLLNLNWLRWGPSICSEQKREAPQNHQAGCYN